MRRVVTLVSLLALCSLILAFGAGCEELKAKVEKAENPAPAGEYLGIEGATVLMLNEKANYAWEIRGVKHDAVTTADTRYFVDMEPVSFDDYDDARDNEGRYDGDNLSMDDTYDILVEPDGIIALLNVNIGD